MRLLVHYNRISNRLLEHVEKILDKYDVDYEIAIGKIDEEYLRDFDIALVLGGDREVLSFSHYMRDYVIPIFGVNISGSTSFLTELSINELEMGIEKLILDEYNVVTATRIEVLINDIEDKSIPLALNEVAIFPSRSATLMEYLLIVDGEEIWRDYSDGVIVATPTGSTAYSLSVGGPILLPSSKTFVIVSVNSLDLTRRPLVVSENSVIELKDISSRCDCEVIIDGSYRFKIEDRVKIRKAKTPIKFVKITKEPETLRRMTRKVMLAKELMDMPPSAKLILKVLEYEGPLTQKDIIAKTLLPPRTVRHALSILLKRGLISKQPLLRDARQDLYYVNIKLKS